MKNIIYVLFVMLVFVIGAIFGMGLKNYGEVNNFDPIWLISIVIISGYCVIHTIYSLIRWLKR